MWWYGCPLDWSRIDSLKEEEHGRWFPENLSSRAEFTDFVWTPRDEEVNFQCEELPTLSDIATRGSRYFHAIYNGQQGKIIHLDGALRVFDEGSWNQRKKLHLRKSGKIGDRIKLFRIDTPIERDFLGDLCSNYFIWNNDVVRYFGADLSESILEIPPNTSYNE